MRIAFAVGPTKAVNPSRIGFPGFGSSRGMQRIGDGWGAG